MRMTAAVIEFTLAGLVFGAPGLAVVGALYVVYGLAELASCRP